MVSTQPDTSPAGFRADVEGLRAIAIVAVVCFHAHVPGITGGYIGVDVFFVISGFLITGMLYRDAAKSRIELARFYGARARRLLPAAGLVIVVTAVAVVVWLLSAAGTPADARGGRERVCTSRTTCSRCGGPTTSSGREIRRRSSISGRSE